MFPLKAKQMICIILPDPKYFYGSISRFEPSSLPPPRLRHRSLTPPPLIPNPVSLTTTTSPLLSQPTSLSPHLFYIKPPHFPVLPHPSPFSLTSFPLSLTPPYAHLISPPSSHPYQKVISVFFINYIIVSLLLS